MSNDTVVKNAPFKFISYDAADAQGVRSEVLVQENRGTIKEIKTEKQDKGFVDVHFNVAGLNFPVHGWISVNSPVFKLVETARDNNEEVSFRIESQRKKGVDATIPMSELRSDTATAQKNVRTVLVGINGVYTDELMTDPAEDASWIGGRQPARSGSSSQGSPAGSTVNLNNKLDNLRKIIADGGVRTSVLDAMVASLLLDGAVAEDVHQIVAGVDKRETTRPNQQASFSVEAPSWKDYNSDGRPNLGSGVVAAAVGIETLLSEQFRELVSDKGGSQSVSNFDDTVAYYLNILLAICDRVQMLSYGEGFRPDRAASSHTRIRGIVYELVKKETTLPVDVVEENGTIVFKYDEKKHFAWVKYLGETGVIRFRRSIEAAFSYPGFRAEIPASLRNGTASPQAPVQAQRPETKVEAATAPQAAPEPPVAVVEEEVTPELVEQPVVAAEIVDVSNFYPMAELTDEQVEGEEKATVETMKALAKLFESSGFNLKDQSDMSRVAELLGATFGPGYTSPRAIPDDILVDFIDHYESYGTEVLHAAISYAHSQPVRSA